MPEHRASQPVGQRLERLTPRELQILALMVDGLERSAIAKRLHVSPHTVRTHMQNLQAKLGVHSGVAAVSVALRAGLRPGDRPEDTHGGPG